MKNLYFISRDNPGFFLILIAKLSSVLKSLFKTHPIMKKTASLFILIILCITAHLSAQKAVVISATGTGQTTGTIANLSVKNDGESPLKVLSQTVFIPSSGQYQPYVAVIPETALPPGVIITIPIDGYCVDVHTPPVPYGYSMTPEEKWQPVGDPTSPIPEGTISLLPTKPLPEFVPTDIPAITQSPGYTPFTGDGSGIIINWPDTDIPVGGVMDPNKDPETFAPVIVEVLADIIDAVDIILKDDQYDTPFSGNPEKERESVIQQTFWIYMAEATGDEYTQDDFAGNVYDQFRENTGNPVTSLPEEQKKKIDNGIGDFWNTFTAVGVEAKVLNTKEGATGLRKIQKDKTAPVDIAHPSADRKCIRFGQNPNIDSRTGFDLMGDLYRQGKIPSDYLNDMRFGKIAEKVNTIRAMHQSLKTVLEAQYKMFPCEKEMAHNAKHPVSFPPFPWEEFFLTVDFCDPANKDKNKLSDYIDPDADPAAITAWMKQFEIAIDNVGVWNPGETSYMEGFQRSINHALSGIADAYKRFEDSMYGSMELSFNRSRAESRLWSAVTTIVAAAVSAGIGAAAGGAWAAMASVFVSGTGFVWEQGLEALGADPKVASLVASLMTLSMGVASSWGAGLVEIIGEEVVTGLPAEMISSGGSAMNQGQVEGFAMSMAMLDDEVWNKLMKDLAKDYDKDALARMNGHRETMRAEIGRHIKELCKVLQSLEALLPAAVEAHKNASEWLHSKYWKDLWREGMDQSLDCCCEWSDGTGPDAACKVTIPPFGHAPGKK